jgi:hypothetical protein
MLTLLFAVTLTSLGLATPAFADDPSKFTPTTVNGVKIKAAASPGDAGVQVTYINIVARHSNKCADVERGSTADRANIYQYTCNLVGAVNQEWYMVGVGGIYYEIRARHSNKCMDVEGPSTADRADIHQFLCRGTTNQHWSFREVAQGFYEIRAQHSGKCMDVEGPSTADRADIHQFSCRGTTNQHWYFVLA